MWRNFSFVAMLFIVVFLVACGESEEVQSIEENPESIEGQEDNSEKVLFRLGHAVSSSKDSPHQQGAEKFKELVEEKTNNNVVIEIYPDGQLGGEREMIEAVQLGTLDMVLTSTGPLSNFSLSTAALDFPFLYKDIYHAREVFDGEIGEEISTQLEEMDLKILTYMEGGFRHITNSIRPIEKPEDMKGMKIRTMENQVHLDSFAALSASPTPMSFTEVFTSLQQGVLDGQETPLTVIETNKLHEIQPHLSLTGHIYAAFPIVMSLSQFNQLTPEYQEAILEAAQEARDYERNFVEQKDEEILEIFKKEGVQIVENIDITPFQEAIKPVYDKYEEQFGEIHQKIFEME